MNDERFNYKASELNDNDEKIRIKNLCNEYGFNFGSSRKKYVDVFDECLNLKHFNKEHK